MPNKVDKVDRGRQKHYWFNGNICNKINDIPREILHLYPIPSLILDTCLSPVKIKVKVM